MISEMQAQTIETIISVSQVMRRRISWTSAAELGCYVLLSRREGIV